MPEDMDNIRILRIIEYTGPREKVEDQVARSLHGEKRLPNGVTIKVATIGTYPEILQNLPVEEGLPGHRICPICRHNHQFSVMCQNRDSDGILCRCEEWKLQKSPPTT